MILNALPTLGSPARKSWLALGATLGIGLALFAAQLLPQWELARLSERGTHASYDYATFGSLVPHHLITMLLPKFYGLYSTATRDGFLPSSELGYVGVLTLGLASAAWFSTRRREVIFWIAIAFLALFLALGRNNPVYPLLYRFVPGISTFRTPGCWLLIMGWALSMLAALGLDTLRSDAARALRAARLMAVVLGLMALAIAFILLFEIGSQSPPAEVTPLSSWGQLIWLLLGALLAASMAFPTLRFQPKFRRAVLLAMPISIALDLFFVAQDMEMQQTLSVAAVEVPSPLQKILQAQQNGAVAERFWPGADPIPMEKWQNRGEDARISPLDHRAAAAALVRALMPSCLPAEFKTAGLTGAWGGLMPLRRNARPIYMAQTPKEVRLRWLRLLNVRTHISQKPLDDPQLRLQSSDPLYIYRDADALPRAFWVPDARRIKDENAINEISRPNFDPRREVLLETTNSVGITSKTNELKPKSFPGADEESGSKAVRITDYQPERVKMEVNAPRDGYVVLMDTAFPGWKVEIDGQNASLEVANWMGRAVAVGAGNHRIEMWFEPDSVRFGVFLSLASLSAIAAWVSAILLARRIAARPFKKNSA